MRRPPRETVVRVAFVVSLAVFGFLYGYMSRARGWFPHEILVRAEMQARGVLSWANLAGPINLHDRVYDRRGARTLAPGRVAPGSTLISSMWRDDDGDLLPGLRLVDRDGAILHEWRVSPREILGLSPAKLMDLRDVDVHGAYLFENGDVLVNLEYVATARLDACGRVRWVLEAGNHHSIARAADGAFWIPGTTPEARIDGPRHPEGFPGLRTPVFQDLILRVSESGEVLQTLNVFDVLYDNDLSRHLAEEGVLEHLDGAHLNDVDPLPDSLADGYPGFRAGDLLVSLRHLDLVLVLDPRTGRVKWSRDGPWTYQHDPDWLGDGWIGVFDNRPDATDRGTMLGGSRIVAVHAGTDSVRILFPGPRSEPFYTYHRGKWQRLPNGNLLLTEEEAGRVVEAGPDGATVWEWIQEADERGRVPSVTEARRVDVGRDEVAAWPCAAQGAVSGTASPARPADRAASSALGNALAPAVSPAALRRATESRAEPSSR